MEALNLEEFKAICKLFYDAGKQGKDFDVQFMVTTLKPEKINMNDPKIKEAFEWTQREQEKLSTQVKRNTRYPHG